MALLSISPCARLIGDLITTGLRQYQHADENCEQAGEAGGLHGFTSQVVATDSEKGDRLDYKAWDCSFAKRIKCTLIVAALCE